MRSKTFICRSVIAAVGTYALIFGSITSAQTDEFNQGHRNRDFCQLTILHNNDGESQLINAGSGELEDFGGAARFATLAQREKFKGYFSHGRARRAGSLLLSSGDNFLAGPEFNASLENDFFFDSLLYDILGYDAVILGNHDFDFGPDILQRYIEQSFRRQVKYVSANLDFSAEPGLQGLVDRGKIVASKIVRRCGLRIGIIGATTENLPFISSPRNVVPGDVLEAVLAEIDRLQRRRVTVFILVSHLQDIDEDLNLLPQLPAIDIAIAGGGDELLANEGDLLVPGDVLDPDLPYPVMAQNADGVQVPVVTTAGNYKYLGRLVTRFDRRGNLLAVDSGKSGPLRVAGGDNPDAVRSSGLVQALIVDPVQASVDELAQITIGTTEVGLDGARVNVRATETNLGNLVADGLRESATQFAVSESLPLPDVALVNGGGIRNDDVRGPGNLTVLDTFDISPFGNIVSIVPDIPREQFKEIMENAVARVDGSNPFPDEQGGTGRFAQISGFTMTWDANETPQLLNEDDASVVRAGSRVRQLTLDDGTVIVQNGNVVAGAAITIATADFLARGGDQYPFRDATIINTGVTDQQQLRDYIENTLGGTVTAAQYPEGGSNRNTRLN